MNGPTLRLGGAALALICALTLPASSLAKPSKAPVRYYLALGDSLSQGVQPNASGVSVETDQGYANQLYTILRKQIPTLALVKLGCPGDTTTSMLTGKGNAAAAATYKCDRKGGSQEAAAVALLKAHHAKGEIALVTVDIGANEVDGCTAPGVALLPCVTAGENTIKINTPLILKRLRMAAGKGTAFAAMNLYDPILADYLLGPYAASQGLGENSVGLAKSVNGLIQAADQAQGFKTADVADAFDTYDGTDMVSFDGQLVPKNVAEVCMLSWACTAPPRGPNIHANVHGYKVIAATLESTLGKLR
jgi:lysophospholipase L1-like esterase